MELEFNEDILETIQLNAHDERPMLCPLHQHRTASNTYYYQDKRLLSSIRLFLSRFPNFSLIVHY